MQKRDRDRWLYPIKYVDKKTLTILNVSYGCKILTILLFLFLAPLVSKLCPNLKVLTCIRARGRINTCDMIWGRIIYDCRDHSFHDWNAVVFLSVLFAAVLGISYIYSLLVFRGTSCTLYYCFCSYLMLLSYIKKRSETCLFWVVLFNPP